MLARYLVAGVAGSLLLASSAFAAEDTATKTAAPATSVATNTSFHGDWRTSKVVGLNVYNEKNENVGSINDLLMDKSGNIKAAVISVGGFLGMGARLIAVPFDKVKFSEQPVSSTTTSNAAPPAGRPASTTTGSTANPPAATTTTKANPWYPDHAMISGDKEELKKLPEFKYE